MLEALVDLSVVHALVPEKRLTQLVVATVVEGAGIETRLFTSRKKGVISTDSDFLYTHGLLENCLQFKVYDVFLGGMQRNNLVLPLSIRRLILSMLSNDLSFGFIAKYSGYPEKKIKELKTRFIKEGLLQA